MAMELASGIKLTESMARLVKVLTALIKQALATLDLQQRVLLYLRAAQEAVSGLGTGRQQILADARRCTLENAAQVNALWERMGTYLLQDHVRPKLQEAIDGHSGV